MTSLPESRRNPGHVLRFEGAHIVDGEVRHVAALVCHDDQCGNGHNTFSITGVVSVRDRRLGYMVEHSSGCVHEDIARAIPQLAPYLKWHLCSTDGPLHYVANTVYLAGDRDHAGLREGERRPMVDRSGLPMWEIQAVRRDTGEEVSVHALKTLAMSVDRPEVEHDLVWSRCMRVGEGKDRDLDGAREAAIWPEATDEQMTAEPAELEAALLARLPALMLEFKAAVESLGLVY
jgi:hypothetical protein